MENPYNKEVSLRNNDMHNAWEEGDANGDAKGYARGKADRYEQIKRQRTEIDSQKQIVSELEYALQQARAAFNDVAAGRPVDSTTVDTVKYAIGNVQAIAKAKGE